MEITRGTIPSAKKVVIYGPEGIGKSTLASRFPDPVFIDTEGSTKEMDVARFDAPKKWEDIFEAIKYMLNDAQGFKTLVLDTADWAEMLCTSYTCQKGGVNGIEDFGYGKGYTYLQENFKKLLDRLNDVIAAGINVVVTAHAKMRKFEQPDEMGAYDRWEMKLSRQVAPMLKEWGDMVLFANYKTFVVTDDKTKSKKAQGGKRVMYTTHNPCWDAKNRYGLDDCLDFDYEEIRKVIEPGAEKPKKKAPKAEPKPEQKEEEQPKVDPEADRPEIKKLRERMAQDDISEERLTFAVSMKGQYFSNIPLTDYPAEFIENNLIAKWSGFVKFAKKCDLDSIKDMPFN